MKEPIRFYVGGYAHVLCELVSTIHVFRSAGDGSWFRVQTISVVPEGCKQGEQSLNVTGAALRFTDPSTLCASVRGLDCLTLIQVNDDGLLGDRHIVASCGKTPRDFLPVEQYLFAANQDSDCIQIFRREGKVCAPVRESITAIKPTCLCLDNTPSWSCL